MASKLSRQVITVFSSLAFIGGCSQILGISDYEVDPTLGGDTSNAGGEGGSGSPANDAGANAAGSPSHAGTSHGGQPAEGGAGAEPSVAGSPPTGDAGAGPLGDLVDCDSADCCAEKGGRPVGVEMLKDGGFELGSVADGNPYWTQLSTNDDEIITSDPSYKFIPHGGDYYAYLSGIPGERSTLYTETVTVPSDAGWLVVSGYRLFQIDLPDSTNADFCGIGFYEVPPKDALEIPFYWSGPADSTDGWGDTANWKRFERSWDATPHRGLKRRLGFVGESDKYPDAADVAEGDPTSSSYLFDDVSLKAFRCYK